MNVLPIRVVGILGTTLDRGAQNKRWYRWRPTVALGMQPDLPVSSVDLLFQAPFFELARQVQADLRDVAPAMTVHLHEIPKHDPWDFEEVYDRLADWAQAHPPREGERSLLHISTGSHVTQICMFLLAEAGLLPRELLQTSPGSSPAGKYNLIHLDLSRYDRIAARFAAQHQRGQRLLTGGLESRSAAYAALIARIEQVAMASTAPILLGGPTGAGKTWMARRIYELRRSHSLKGPFVEVNCATLRGDGAMSALFGHARGAFTGALQERAGLLKSADKGLLFLDEVGELGVEEQAMLLRAIEERRFVPLGSDREQRSDFQLIAGTNRDLREAVASGHFREDLLARLDVWSFVLPGLRDRLEDLEGLLDQELRLRGEQLGRRLSLSTQARDRWLEFARAPEAEWRGNLRDLGGSVLRMATLAPGGRVDLPTVEEELERLRARWSGGKADILTGLLTEQELSELDHFDRVQLEEVVRVCRRSRSQSEAGRVLFAASRRLKANPNDADRLGKYLTKFGLDFERLRS